MSLTGRSRAPLLLACFALVASLMASCTGAPVGRPAAAPTVRIATLKGPTGVGMVHLMQAQRAGTATNDYSFTVTDSPDEVAAKVASGDVDIAAVPTNLAAALYAKTSGGVQLLAVNTLGVLYVLENGSSIHSVADLKGRTIYASGQGANPEYVMRFLLQQNGLDPDTDVTLVFKSEHAEVATLAAQGFAAVVLLPEPFVTTASLKNHDLRVALDLTAEWAKVVTGGSQLMMGGVIARTDFVAKHRAAVTAFLTEYQASIAKATTDVDGTAALCEEFAIIPSAAVAKLALSRLGLTYLAGEQLETGIKGYFQVLYAANPKSLGGVIPDSGFFFTAQ